MTNNEMEELLQEIRKLCAVVYAHEAHWKVSEMVLAGPASDDDIRALEAELPHPLSPSYKQFLRLHDGCINFWPKFVLLGTKGEAREKVKEKVEDAALEQGAEAGHEDGKLSEEEIREFEEQQVPEGTPPYYFISSHPVIGTDRAGSFFLLDRKSKRPDGEMEVILYTYDGRVEERYAEFPALLTATYDDLAGRIKKKKYKSAASA
jgi:cell wall assembly regulator SMI1